MKDERPYCYECSRKRTDGYKLVGRGWVCSVCLKPSYRFWINQMLINEYWDELDKILDRIMTKDEKEDGMDRGRAETACLFIAMILRPHDPDPKFVRDMAIKRYRERIQA